MSFWLWCVCVCVIVLSEHMEMFWNEEIKLRREQKIDKYSVTTEEQIGLHYVKMLALY